MKAAACYLRVSTDEQTEYSPAAQLSAVEEYAARNAFTITAVYRDEGLSGRQAEKRPGFMRMISDARQKPCPFECILVHKLDRFSRSREDSVIYKAMLRRECGVKVISITETLEEDKFSVILEAMLEAMAEYYSLNLAEEVKKGMTEKAKQGGFQAAPPYGYAVSDNLLVPLPDEAEVVRMIFGWYTQGFSYREIAKTLNQNNKTTRRGKPFSSRSVEYILHNPVYIGKLRWTPTGKAHRNYAHPDTIVATGEHQPIIGIEVWKKTQTRAKNDFLP